MATTTRAAIMTEHGAPLLVDEIELDDVLTIDFQLEDQEISALGRVVWCIDVDPIVQEVGLEFLDLPPDSAEFLQSFLGGLEPA